MKRIFTAVRSDLKESLLCILDVLFLDFCLYHFGWSKAGRSKQAACRFSETIAPARQERIKAA